MLKHFKIIILLFFGFIFSSCATLVNGTSQSIAISSNPSGATVYIDGLLKGETPLFVDLSTKNEHKVVIELLGYDKQLVLIKSSLSTPSLFFIASDAILSILGNSILDPVEGDPYKDTQYIVVGPALFVGFVFTEFYFGAINKLTPENINVKLQKSKTASIDKQDKLLTPENK